MSQVQKLRCDKQPGRMVPVVNRNRCEAKADCVSVCPYHVFEIRALTAPERKELSLPGRLKLLAHGGKQAFAVRMDDCRACGLCVRECPEKAISLVLREATFSPAERVRVEE